VLLAGELEVPCTEEQGINWLAFPTLATAPADVPEWAEELLGQRPLRAARAGPENGYLILETATDSDLHQATSPGAALAAHTPRALILTCRMTNSVNGEHIHYRYFAPQYGTDEDIATGSAMRVLAAYWGTRGLGPRLSALQCSREGGWLRSRAEGETTWVGGHVAQQKQGYSL
jgi:predicted PhzF superfamily epimerase YddE/YHI9